MLIIISYIGASWINGKDGGVLEFVITTLKGFLMIFYRFRLVISNKRAPISNLYPLSSIIEDKLDHKLQTVLYVKK